MRRGGSCPAARASLVLALSVAFLLGGPGRDARASSVRLAGLLPLSDAARERWPFSGAFLYPVGDAHDFTSGERGDSTGFHVLRGMHAANADSPEHLGVDLGNGHGGGTVRAVSGGVVVRGAADGAEQGFGHAPVM